MTQIISYCGLECHNCEAFIAAKNNDDKLRAELAKKWTVQYKKEIVPAMINCKGCLHEGETIFAHCKVCKVRKCAKEKKVANCAYCNEYPCEKLEEFFNMSPDMKTNLDAIKNEKEL